MVWCDKTNLQPSSDLSEMGGMNYYILLLLAGCQKLGLQAGGFNPTDEY